MEIKKTKEEIEQYKLDELVLKSLKKAGDDLTQKRKVDHWLYFSRKENLEEGQQVLENLDFSTELLPVDEKMLFPYGLKIERIDHVDIKSIYAVTSQLRKLAQQLDGTYDGWGTLVVKKSLQLVA